jgi:hypothetical protein
MHVKGASKAPSQLFIMRSTSTCRAMKTMSLSINRDCNDFDGKLFKCVGRRRMKEKKLTI